MNNDKVPVHLLRSEKVEQWNAWRAEHATEPLNLSGIDLKGKKLDGVNLKDARLERAQLQGAQLNGAQLDRAHLKGADLSDVSARGATLSYAVLADGCLRRANLRFTECAVADFTNCDLSYADLQRASLMKVKLDRAVLEDTNLTDASVMGASLRKAKLRNTALYFANLTAADLTDAELGEGCKVWGTAVWSLRGVPKRQERLSVISKEDEEEGNLGLYVDDIRAAQFLYSIMQNENLGALLKEAKRHLVLLLGRFAEPYASVLQKLSAEIGKRPELIPMVFDFDPPEGLDTIETAVLLSNLSFFVIADLTAAASVPLEVQAIVPNNRTPLVPIIKKGYQPFSMFKDLRRKYEWVLDPVEYDDTEDLLGKLDHAILNPARAKREELVARQRAGSAGPHPPAGLGGWTDLR
jgi:pentapeptide repeat protein